MAIIAGTNRAPLALFWPLLPVALHLARENLFCSGGPHAGAVLPYAVGWSARAPPSHGAWGGPGLDEKRVGP
jgi:hypothetical protein